MSSHRRASRRPPIHALASESDLIARLALRAEHANPVVAAMLLEEIDRAELHAPETMPTGRVMLNSNVMFIDERTRQLREVQLVLPGHANIAEGRISIMTPMGAALYGLGAGDSIDWPDLQRNSRQIRIIRVSPPDEDADFRHSTART
jgi:regulator of nucleoside diphosphate kinase